jgi:hypothetical protein
MHNFNIFRDNCLVVLMLLSKYRGHLDYKVKEKFVAEIEAI